MKYFAVADNRDTLTGLRLAGIEGRLCKTAEAAQKELDRALADPDVAIVLINEALAKMCESTISEMRLRYMHSLIVEIPDRSGAGRPADSITRFIREAIGVKV